MFYYNTFIEIKSIQILLKTFKKVLRVCKFDTELFILAKNLNFVTVNKNYKTYFLKKSRSRVIYFSLLFIYFFSVNTIFFYFLQVGE